MELGRFETGFLEMPAFDTPLLISTSRLTGSSRTTSRFGTLSFTTSRFGTFSFTASRSSLSPHLLLILASCAANSEPAPPLSSLPHSIRTLRAGSFFSTASTFRRGRFLIASCKSLSTNVFYNATAFSIPTYNRNRPPSCTSFATRYPPLPSTLHSSSSSCINKLIGI